MDPTEIFPAEIVDQILCNLAGSELLACCLVSKNWNNHFGSSIRCMNKILLVISGARRRCVKDIVSIPSRKYQHIKVHKPDNLTEWLMSCGHLWKSVAISSATYSKTSALIELLKTFETSVRDLLLYNVKVLNEDTKEISDLSFGQLRSLSMRNCEGLLKAVNLFQNCFSLRKATFVTQEKNIECHLNEILKNQRDLKMLELVTAEAEVSLITGWPFRLEEMNLGRLFIKAEDRNEFIYASLLESQMGLKKLVLPFVQSGSDYIKLIQIALEMKQLKDLEFFWMPWIKDEDLTQNTSIERLKVKTSGYHRIEHVATLFKAMPNIRELTLGITKELMRCIAENLQHIQIIRLEGLENMTIDCDDEIQSILPHVRFEFISE